VSRPCAAVDVDVSVIIPTRNRLPLLKEAVASVEKQDYPNWRLVLVDDASDDGTWRWIQSVVSDRLTGVRIDDHSERSVARNLGVQRVTSPLTLLLDDDDRLMPDALGSLVSTLRAYPDAVAVVGGLEYFDGHGNTKRPPQFPQSGQRDMWRDAVWGWVAHTGRTLFRTDVVRLVGGFRPGLVVGEDRDLWLRVCRLGPVAFCPDVVLEHRLHPAQWRPVGVRDIEADITRRHIATLPADDRRDAERIARAAALFDRAREDWGVGRGRSAARSLVKLVVLHPYLVYSYIHPRVTFSKAIRFGAAAPFDARGAAAVRRLRRRIRSQEVWQPTFPQERDPSAD